MRHRTPAYWPTRILLLVGIFATAITFVLAPAMAVTLAQPPMFGPEPTVLGLPARIMVPVLGVTVAMFGLVWMVRIFRGPRDEPRAWRHRDR